jgi:hypothetical protein
MRARTSLLCFASLVAAGLLASGCSANGFSVKPPSSPTQSHRNVSFMSPAVVANGAQLVYLSAFVAGTVYIYDQRGNMQSPIGQIGGLSAPAGLAITSGGDLYVASQSAGTVSAFHNGETTPFKVLTGGTSLGGVAVNAKGTVYANNGFSNQIYVWAHGSLTPTKTLTAAFTDNCDDIALDANGNLFVDSLFGEFEEFKAGSGRPIKLFTTLAYNAPFGISIDAAGDLVTAFTGGTVAVFPPPYDGSTLGTFKYSGLIYAIALSKSEKFLWAGNMTGPGGTVGQAYSFPGGKLRKTTSNADISGDAILGVATSP